MARRRYRKSHQVVESHIREEESPWHSLFHPTIRDLVKSSRSIAHSNDFEGHKLYKQILGSYSYWIWKYYIDVLRRATTSNP